jgi:hypothetical protein
MEVVETFWCNDVLMVIRYYKQYFHHSSADSVCWEFYLRIGGRVSVDLTMAMGFSRMQWIWIEETALIVVSNKVKTFIQVLFAIFAIIKEFHHFRTQMEYDKGIDQDLD